MHDLSFCRCRGSANAHAPRLLPGNVPAERSKLFRAGLAVVLGLVLLVAKVNAETIIFDNEGYGLRRLGIDKWRKFKRDVERGSEVSRNFTIRGSPVCTVGGKHKTDT